MTARDKFFEHDGQRISYREAEVLLCCARGMTIQQTADLLYIGYSTAKTHREHLRTRFGLEGHHTLACLAAKILPELEKSVTLPTEIGNISD
jgi:DNA-binding CsgD family transcriptional regulator